MNVLKTVLVFGVALATASPFNFRHRQVSDSTASTTVSHLDPTVTSTITLTIYTTDTTSTITLNCTRSIYAQPPPASTTPAVPPVLPTSSAFPTLASPAADPPAFLRRQGTGTGTGIYPGTGTAPPPGSTTAPSTTTRPYVTITRTVWIQTTVHPVEPWTVSTYACLNTVAWLYTVDDTSTIHATRTHYATTSSVTLTLSCGFGGGGGGPVPSPTLPAVPSPTPPTQPAKRQTAASTARPHPGTIVTSTIHLTRTVYSVATVSKAVTTNTRYVCSSTVTPAVLPSAPPATTY